MFHELQYALYACNIERYEWTDPVEVANIGGQGIIPRLDGVSGPVPSLKDLCQRVAAQSVVEPKNALQVLEFADALSADILKGHCKHMATTIECNSMLTKKSLAAASSATNFWKAKGQLI
ncbi:unnamed protein product [Calypogeia fissa]